MEALALMYQLRASDQARKLLFDNVDGEPSWESVYVDLTQTLSKWVPKVELEARFFQLDISREIKGDRYEVVFVPWVLSELDLSCWDTMLTLAVALACPGGCLVLMDRPEPALVSRVCEWTASAQGCSLVEHSPEWEKHCGLQIPDDLRDHFWVQLNCSTAYWVLSKS